MAVFLDVLPRLGLTEAESAFAKLKEMAATTGKEMGLSLGDGASAGLKKLEDEAVSAERVVSDANRKMVVSSQMYEAQLKKVAEVEKARGADSAAYAAATARLTDIQMKHTTAVGDHSTAELAAADASGKFANAKDNAGKSVATTAGILNGVGAASFLAFGAAIGLTTDKAMNFQASQERLVTSAGESAANLKQVSDGILAMAGTVGYSSGELSKGMYTVESAGFRAADGLTVLKASAQLAKSENADLATTTDAVTTALHDYHLPADQAAEVSSKLVTAVSQGKTTVEAFAGSLHSVQPLAASLGININDLYGSLAAMTASGESADQSTQNMADALRHLSSPTIAMSKNLSDIGIDSRQLSANLGTTGLAGTMQEVSQAVLQHMGPSGMVLLNTFNQSKQAADDANTMFKAMPESLQKIAQTAQTTGDFATFRKSIGGLTLEQRNLATEWLSAANNAEGFNNKLKAGGPDVETYTQALQGAVGDASSLNVALQLSGENAAATSKNIQELADAHKNADSSVKGFNETEETMKQKLDEAKAGFGAAAIELGNVFLPAMTSTINALKDTAEFLAQHKTLADALVIAIGGIAAAWVAAKGVMVFGTIIDGVKGMKAAYDAVKASVPETNDAMKASGAAAAAGESGVVGATTVEAGAEAKVTTAALEANAAMESAGPAAAAGEAGVLAATSAEDAALAGVTAAAGTAAAAFSTLAVAAGAWMFWANGKYQDNPDAKPTDENARARGANALANSGGNSPIPKASLGADAPADRRGLVPGSAGESVPNAVVDRRGLVPGSAGEQVVIPTPPPGTDPGAIQNAAPGDAAPGGDGGPGGGGDPATKAKKAKAPAGSKDDPIWVSPQKPEDFKSGGKDDHGVTGSSIIANGPDFTPKGIGTFFSALLIDLAMGNPIGQTLADKKRGESSDRPMYVTEVDVDKAQAKLDKAIQDNGPDSEEAKKAQRELDATKAAVGTKGGYYDPKTGAITPRDPSQAGYPGDSALLANVPAGKYSQDASRDLFKGLSDCSSSVGDLVNALDGQKSGTGGNLTTGNAASWLPAHGFVPNTTGANVPGAFNVGYNSEHMQATLPGGTNWNYGSDAAAAKRGIDGGGAFDPSGGGTGAFTQHYYRPGGGGSVYTGDAAPAPSSGGTPDATDNGSDPTDLSDVPYGTGQGLPFNHNLKASPASLGSGMIPGGGGPGAQAARRGGVGGTPPAPNAAPGSDVGAANQQPIPRSWGSGKGFSTSIGATLGSAAGGLFPGGGAAGAVAGKLIDRTIGYGAQVGGIAVEGLMQSLIPTGGGGGIGDPSHSILGKVAGGVAGAHKTAPDTAGTTAPPGPKKDDDKDKAKQPAGDTHNIGTQQTGGINSQGGDIHIHTNDNAPPVSDQPQNQYPTSTR